MKKSSKKRLKLHKAISLTGSAVLLCGLLAGFPASSTEPLAVTAEAASYSAADSESGNAARAASYYNVQPGAYYRVTADALNVRSGPGTAYNRQGKLGKGTLVQILDTNGDWGRITSGWVHLRYLDLESGALAVPNGGYTAVVNASMLNIRSGPGTNYAIIGKVTNGFKANIQETRGEWGSIGNGWINLNYTYLPGAPTTPSNPTTPPSGGSSVIYANSVVEVTADRLNVRQAPGTGYGRTGYLYNGQRVTVLEVQNGWGRIQNGWISLQFVRPVNTYPGTTVPGNAITAECTVEVTADSLRVRSGPGTNYQQNGSITKGSRVYIYEVQGNWGRTSNGWISLDYVYRIG